MAGILSEMARPSAFGSFHGILIDCRVHRQENDMATNPFNTDTRAAEQTMKQAIAQTRGAWDGYFDFILKTLSSFPADGTELGGKVRSYTEQNIVAAKEFVDELSHAKDVQDIFRIQTEYMQSQISNFVAQTRGLGEAFTRTITTEVKMPFK
jgi:hypothetical protein